MKRHSSAGSKPVRPRVPKRSPPKRDKASKPARNRSTSIAGQEPVVARLTQERDEALLRETANSEILRLISKSPGDLESVFRTILEHATSICNANFGTLFRFDGERFYPVAEFNTPAALLEAQTRRGPFQPEPGTAMDHVMRTKQVSHSADKAAESFPGFFAEHGGARSQVAVPVLKDDLLVGVIVIYRQEVRPFTGKQIGLLQNFAAQAVIAIENARLLNELRQRTDELSDALEQQTATSEVLRVISNSLSDTQPVFESIVRSGVALFSEAAVSIALVDNGMVRAAAVADRDLARAEAFRSVFPFPLTPEYMHSKAILDRKMLDIPDVEHAPADLAVGAKNFLRSGYRAVTIVPLMRGGQAIGALSVVRVAPGPLSDKQLATLKTYANQAIIAIENTRLLSELKQSLEQQTATAEVLRVISSSPGELVPVFNSMLENAMRICSAGLGALYRYDGNAFSIAAYVGVSTVVELMSGGPFHPHPDSVLGRIFTTRDIVDVPDATQDPGYLKRIPVWVASVDGDGTRSMLGVPMMKENTLIGALVILRREARPFTDKEVELVKNFAAQAVIAIENARLLNELKQSLEQQTATADILRVISSSPGELKPVFEAMLEKAMQLCEAAFGGMWTLEAGSYTAVALRGVPQPYAAFLAETTLVPGPGTAPYRFLQGERFVHNLDLASEEAYRAGDPQRRALVDLGGARTAVQVPLCKDESVLGVITIYRQEVRPFTDKQIALVQNFAAQAVIAIENARLLNELHRRTTDLTESLEQQTATSEVLRVISASPSDMMPVFQTMLAKATELCGASYGALWLRVDEGFRYAALHGDLPQNWTDHLRNSTVIRVRPDVPLARMLQTLRPVSIPDMRTDPGYLNGDPLPVSGVDIGGIRTLVVVPMIKNNDLVGAIAIYRKEVRPFAEKQIELLSNFAAQAVIAIENTRLLDDLNKLNQQLEQRVADQVGEIERMSRLRRFLPPQVADLIVASGTEKQLESHRREITALFCDLRGFTGFSESSDPEDVMALLAEYHAAIGQIIIKYSGTLERYAGDGVMVIFNDPVPVENPALQAVLMALEMRTAIEALMAKWRLLGHDIGFGIGIAHGFATLGTIGFEGRRDYAAIGTVSNVASRLCDEAKPGQILISPRVLLAVDKAVTVEQVGEFALKGIRRPMLAYNVLESLPSKPN